MRPMSFLFGLALALAPLEPVHADPRWVPWLGCWELSNDGSGDPGASRRVSEDIQVCMTPIEAEGDEAEGAAVKMLTSVSGHASLEERVVANGTRQIADESGCRGWRSAEWSHDGERLFTTAELSCEGQPARKVWGLSLMARGPIWVDVQAVDIGGQQIVRARRYRRAGGQDALPPAEVSRWSRLAGPSAGAAAMSIEDVIEAHRKVGARAVEVALVETRTTFDLDKQGLLTLAEADVDPRVVDAMVAMSFPEHFEVSRRDTDPSWSMWPAGGLPMFVDPYWSLWSPNYALSYQYAPYYYTPFGYSYWWGGYGPYYYVPGGGGGGGVRRGDGDGRAVYGRGYTRAGAAADGDEAVVIGRAKPRSAPSGNAGSIGGSSGGSGSAGTGSGSGGSVSPQGYSSGRGGGDSGRSARPRQ